MWISQQTLNGLQMYMNIIVALLCVRVYVHLFFQCLWGMGILDQNVWHFDMIIWFRQLNKISFTERKTVSFHSVCNQLCPEVSFHQGYSETGHLIHSVMPWLL